MTPYEFGILLHYFCQVGDPDEIRAPIGPATIEKFLELELLTFNADSSRCATYRITECGEVFVRAALDTPLPVHQWVIPERKAEGRS